MDTLLSERFSQELDGVLGCYDRVVIQVICIRCAMPNE